MPIDFGGIGNTIGNGLTGAFRGLSGEAERALGEVRGGLDRIAEVTASLPNLTQAAAIDLGRAAQAIGTVSANFDQVVEDLQRVGRIDVDLARQISSVVAHTQDAGGVLGRDVINASLDGRDDLRFLRDTQVHLESIRDGVISLGSIGNPDNLVFNAIVEARNSVTQAVNNLKTASTVLVFNNTQAFKGALDRIDVSDFADDPINLVNDFTSIVDDLAAQASRAASDGVFDTQVRADNFASVASPVARVGAEIAAEAEAAAADGFADPGLLQGIERQIERLDAALDTLQGAGIVSQALRNAQTQLDRTVEALSDAVAAIGERVEAVALVGRIAEEGWAEALGGDYLEAISGEGAVFGEIVEDIAKIVDFEAIGAAFQDVATLDIDLSAATLDRYARVLDLPSELITPQIAGVFQQLSPEALAGIGAATGAIFESITKSAVDGVTEGFDTSIAFLQDLAEQIGDGILGVINYIQSLLERYAREVADTVVDEVFTPLQETALDIGEELIALGSSATEALESFLEQSLDQFGGVGGLIEFAEDAAGVVLDGSARERVVDNLANLIGVDPDSLSLNYEVTENGVERDTEIDFFNFGPAVDARSGILGGRAGSFLDLLNSDVVDGDLIFGALAEIGLVADLTFLNNTPFDIETDLVATARANLFSDNLGAPVPVEIAAGFDFDARIELELGALLGVGTSTVGISFSALQDVGFVPNTTQLLDDPSRGVTIDATPDFLRTDIEIGFAPEAGDRIRFSQPEKSGPLASDAIFELDSFAPITTISEDGRNFSEFRVAVTDGGLGMLATGPEGTVDTARPIAEVGSVVLDHRGATVSLEHDFESPVVFAHVATINGGDAVTARITDVRDDGFDLFLQEPDGYDGFRHRETVSFIVVEEGTHVLSDGTILSASKFEVEPTTETGFEQVAFDGFDDRPAVLAGVQSFNDRSFVDTRIRNVSSDGVEVALEEEEGRNSVGSHGTETVGVLGIEQGAGVSDANAFEAGTTGISVDHVASAVGFNIDFDEVPFIFADLSTQVGIDPSRARTLNLSEDGFDVFVQEDLTQDAELQHAPEAVDYLAFAESGLIYGDTFDFV
ncbi:hypothetical protein OCH239_12875 [Roseivivax halodurans JCM 10272]|uniref:Uncharacterized protein n=1 Tax=Roseivivax halodurans JCM 10272 TaxID=1449350 RepID=X7EBF9_9RHOB|nr:hypothetical protein [Roseivivax halodurans]ETX13210.1 hypothetical protein OCH239_12875 [Roseivivax halodurans JCM 10272]